jgi:hypothetical protein
MKRIDDNSKLSASSGSNIHSSELDENQEYDRIEYLEDIFYSFSGENQNNLADDIKSWEACRFLI